MPGRWIEAQAFPLVLLTVLLAAGCSVLQEEPGDQGENWVEERNTCLMPVGVCPCQSGPTTR